MIIHPGFVGIDISKLYLDVFDGRIGRAERFANSKAGVETLAARFAAAGGFVLFEATGRYDQCLRLALTNAGVRFARINPARARDFARAAGFLAKTDAIDARMLAAMAQTMRPAPSAIPDPERETLAVLTRRRDQLVDIRAQERNRLSDEQTPGIAADITEHLAWLDAAIVRVTKAVNEMIAQSDNLRRAAALLRSAPGVGPVTASVLLALMPELGARTSKSIAALAGIAPLNADSGQFRGHRMIAGGRKRVRDALYMAAVAIIRTRTPLRDFYDRLKAAGKPAKVALIAVARKLLTSLNAMLRDQAPYGC